MKRVIFTVLMIAVSTIILAEQQQKTKIDREKMNAQKVAFITEQVQLTPDEAQKFWPLYNELQQKIKTLHTQRHELEKSLSEISTTSDYKKVNDAIVQYRVEVALLRQAYYKKFENIISAEKISRLFKSEQDFKKVLLRKFEKK